MNSKILLLSIAVIAVGLFAMPSTLSLFAGQHTFYAGDEVSCKKCHQDIYDEMTATGSLSTAHLNTSLKECQGCHRMTNATWNSNVIPFNGTQNLTAGYYSLDISSNPEAHAAVTLECVACHQGVPRELMGSQEAHTQYYLNSSYTFGTGVTDTYLKAQNQTVVKLKGANTACVGCHTHIWVNVTWKRAGGYNLTADESGGGSTEYGKYNLTFTSLNGTSTTYSAGQ